MSDSSSIANCSRLEAEVSGPIVTHRGYRSNPAAGERKVRYVESWRRERLLGHGGSGTVWLQTNIQDKSKVRAVKILTKYHEARGTTDPFDEAVVMSILSRTQNDALFVNFHGWYETHDNLCLVMEYFQHGDLGHYLDAHGALQEADASDIIKQLLEGLDVIHRASFVHRDLKPRNILIQHILPWWVKIGDFGISRRLIDESTTFTGNGTRGYKAPEVLFNERTPHTTAVDMWSLGCITYTSLINELPFQDDREISCCRADANLLSQKIDILVNVSSQAKIFLKSLIVIDPTRRATVEKALGLAWIIDPPRHLDSRATPSHMVNDTRSSIPSPDQETINGPSQYEEHESDDVEAADLSDLTVSDDAHSSYHSSIERVEVEFSQVDQATVLSRRNHQYFHDDKLALRDAVRRDDLKVVSLLLDQGISVDVKYDGNMVPLMYAAGSGLYEMVQLLLDRGANINARDQWGHTSVGLAATGDHQQVIRLLLERGAELDTKDEDGYTPFMRASIRGHQRVVRYLLECGADINATDNHGKTSLLRLCEAVHDHSGINPILDHQMAIMEDLLEQGADVNVKDNTGCTTLLASVKCYLVHCKAVRPSANMNYNSTQSDIGNHLSKCQNIWKRLFDHDANVNLKDADGQTPWMLTFSDKTYYTSCFTHIKPLVELLIDRGADIDTVFAQEGTALMRAVFDLARPMSKLLLNHGASLDIKDNDGNTALMVAANEQGSRLLLDQGAEIDTTNNRGRTALMIASEQKLEAKCILLLDRGANIHAKDTNGYTSLMIAASEGHGSLCVRLLERAARIDEGDENGWTPLMLAVRGAVRRFQTGRDPEASAYDHVFTIRRLIELGARLDLCNLNKQTAYDIAKEHNFNRGRSTKQVLAALSPSASSQSPWSGKLKNSLRLSR